MSTLDDIRDALAKVDSNVFYGTASKLEGGEPWNYTVFSRDEDAPKDTLGGFTQRYEVAVVRESFVPEGLRDDVIAAVSALPGMRLDREKSVEYVYESKPGASRTVVEMMVVHFAKAVKR